MIKKMKINGKEYPCRMTMGAMMQFKQETGKEVSELNGAGLSEVMTLLWCCVSSACRADKVPFDMSLMDMADQVDTNDFASWQNEAFTKEEVKPVKGDKKKA